MKAQWINMEHARLHRVEEWPDGPRKEAALAAIHSALESLAAQLGPAPAGCLVCESRKRRTSVLERNPVFQYGTLSRAA
jgi:hypothetical protein